MNTHKTVNTRSVRLPANKEAHETMWTGLLALAIAAAAAGCDHGPDVIAEPLGEAVTSEAGTRVEVSVHLSRAPSHPIVVRGTSSDLTEGTVSDDLYFDDTNWSRPQTMFVTGVDDDEPDGDVTYEVSLTEIMWKRGHRDEPGEVLTFVNRDDDRVTFDTLGDLPGGSVGSLVADMSADGDVVVGSAESASGTEATRWTPTQHLTPLGAAPSAALGVSPDGTRVVGTATEAGQTQRTGVLWLGDAEAEFLRGGPIVTPGWPLFLFPEPNVVLDDGRIYGACIQYRAYGERLGCRYDGPEQISTLGLSVVFAADADGHVGGTQYGSRLQPIGSLPVLDGRVLGYPPRTPCLIPHDCRAEIRDFSAHAATAVGIAQLPPESDDIAGPEEPLLDVGLVYTEEGGITRLEDLADGEDRAGAYAISADGQVIAGFGTDADGRQAVIWLSGRPLRLRDLLAARGARLPEGYTLHEVRAVSADGRVFAGNGTNAAGHPEGFRVAMLDAPAAP